MKFRLKYRDQELSDREFAIAVLGFASGWIIGGVVVLLLMVF